ncbi:MAG: enoyl-CoA hydratase/isomerase family protein [Candidatus Geothermincolia bacterium]
MTDKIVRESIGDALFLYLARPESYNALDLELLDQLARHTVDASKNPAVRTIVISGQGKAFCAGGDLRWIAAQAQGLEAAFHLLASRLHLSVTELRRMRKPAIAALNGPTAGAGLSIALACDFRVMESSATLKLSYPSAGLCVDGGASFTLPRLIGLAKSLELAAFDQPIDAATALSSGLVTRVCADGESRAAALAMAEELRTTSLTSFGVIKTLLSDSYETSWETQLEREREGLGWSSAQPDGCEGVTAFCEKRRPDFL